MWSLNLRIYLSNAASVFVDENVQNGSGDNIALYSGNETMTYRDISQTVNRTGNALKNLGVDLEERVMLILLDSPEFIASFFGAIKIGAVPIPINTMLKADDFQYFRVGASSVLYPEKPDPEKVFQIIERYRPTLFYGVPTLYAKLLQRLEKMDPGPDMSSLRLCVSAGEQLPAEIYHRWKKITGLEILDEIGSTEALHIFISNNQGKVKPGSSEEIVQGYEARIVDENGTEVQTGEIGNLMI